MEGSQPSGREAAESERQPAEIWIQDCQDFKVADCNLLITLDQVFGLMDRSRN